MPPELESGASFGVAAIHETVDVGVRCSAGMQIKSLPRGEITGVRVILSEHLGCYIFFAHCK